MGIAETIAKNTIFNFITNAFNAAAIFIVGIYLARFLGPEQYGLYSLVLWFLSLAALVVNLGLGDMAKRFIAEAIGQQNIDAVKGLIRLSLIIRSFALLVVSVLILFLSNYLARLFGRPLDGAYFIFVIGLLITSVVAGTLDGVFIGFQKYEYSALISLVSNVLRTVLVIVLCVFGAGVKEVFLIYMAISGLCIIIDLFLVNRLFPLRDLFLPLHLEPTRRNSAIKYSLAAMGILGVDYVLWQNAEIMVLGMFRPVEDVGFYTIAQRVPSMVVALVPFVFGQVLLPAVSEQFGKGDMERIKQIYITASKYLMMLSFPLAAGGIALARPIITVLFGENYSSAIVLMQIIFVPFAMRGLTHAVSSVIYGIKEPVFLLKIGVILVGVSIGLDILLIPKYGTMGAVIATTIPRMIALPFYIRFVSKKIGVPWPLNDTARIVLASVIMWLIVFLIQYFFGNVLGIIFGVSIGVLTYIVALLAFHLIKPQDLNNLRQMEKRLPSPFRNRYLAVIGLLGNFVK